jgi:hypothetical protein
MVLHDWYDDRTVTILRNCRAAAPDGCRALVVEAVIGASQPRAGAVRRLIPSDRLLRPGTQRGLITCPVVLAIIQFQSCVEKLRAKSLHGLG